MPLRFSPARGASVLLSASSRGPDGPTGPTGPTGATGSTGATGPTGPGYQATSVTSNTIAGSGSKSFTTQSGLAYQAGTRVRAADTGAPSTNYMEGVATSYSGTTLIFTADYSTGSGTLSDWTLNVAGERGATGATGATGPAGSMGGPVSSTDNAVARFDGTGGTVVQNSGVIIDDSNNVSGIAALSATTIELGHASDTTISRTGAGAIAVEGVGVALNSISLPHTASTIELGHASDTTISRTGAGAIAVEGVGVALNSTSLAHTASTIELGDASDTTLSRSAAGVLAVEGNPVRQAGKETIWIPASAMWARTTNGPAAASRELTTGGDIMVKGWAFDTTTEEAVQFYIAFPKSWNKGTITFQAFWTNVNGLTTETVSWGLSAGAYTDSDALDTTDLGTEVRVSDTWLAANDIHVSAESAAVTVGNTPIDDDMVIGQIARSVANDNMTGDAELLGIKIFFTTSAATDA